MLHDVMVGFSTRNDNTLDIFCTNRPSLIQRYVSIPKLSDHGIVLIDANILPARKKPIQRHIYPLKSAKIEGASRS